MTTKNKTSGCNHIELTLTAFMFSDFWHIYTQEWKNNELIVTGALPGSESYYEAKFHDQKGPQRFWAAHSLSVQ
jgi:hypothetical protein